ncbi:sensor histidine kinase [Pedobacter sp.]|uniref:sensor histidine kinase n=1 Tax=Pedobacter sp. TaxID=1411316 RepID=UPI003D7FE1BE
MKHLAPKYIYPLVVLSVVISLLLQAAWLSQLFKEEKRRTIDDLEKIAISASKENIYATLDDRFTGNPALKRFFLSAEWVDIWQGFEDAKDLGLYKSFDIDPQADSTTLEFRMVFLQNPPAKRLSPKYNMGYSIQEMNRLDSLSFIGFKQLVAAKLVALGLKSGHSFTVNSYGAVGSLPGGLKSEDFRSKSYGYNLLHLRRAQLVVNSVTRLVLFKMRYFLISSILMLSLIWVAFYFIIRLMISRRLYADARVDFTSNITHEIKTPIATVALALESISKYNLVSDPEKLQRYLNMGKQELQRLSHMVEKVLSLSQEGEIHLSPVFYDVQAGLSDVIQSMELPLQNAGAFCKLAVSPEPCFIEGDAVHLTSVFFNLIENSIKYATRPLELLITCACDEDWVTISFQDNGPGISQIYQDKIFERFFRVPQPGNTHPVKGSGLGLNYVLGIVHRHKGTITLKSEVGEGSTFTIKLPAASNEF